MSFTLKGLYLKTEGCKIASILFSREKEEQASKPSQFHPWASKLIMKMEVLAPELRSAQAGDQTSLERINSTRPAWRKNNHRGP